MKIEPYLNFDGRCEEAIEFYKSALGAKVEMLMRYSESPEAPPPGMVAPGSENKVMHASILVGDNRLMLSDGGCQGKGTFSGFNLSITVTSEADADRIYAALSKGGQVQMPLGKTFFSPKFGMVADKFGIGWMVMVNAA